MHQRGYSSAVEEHIDSNRSCGGGDGHIRAAATGRAAAVHPIYLQRSHGNCMYLYMYINIYTV